MPGESRFSRRLGDIAVTSAANGGLSLQDVLEAMRALNDDMLEREDSRDAQIARIVSIVSDLDPEDVDHTTDRAIIVAEKKFTREQAVVAVILFVTAVVGSNLIGALIERITR